MSPKMHQKWGIQWYHLKEKLKKKKNKKRREDAQKKPKVESSSFCGRNKMEEPAQVPYRAAPIS
jgi:hypothetical protein